MRTFLSFIGLVASYPRPSLSRPRRGAPVAGPRSEPETLNLAGRRLGEIVDEIDPDRGFVGRGAAAHEPAQLLAQRRRRRVPALERDERLGPDELGTVLAPDNSRLQHRRVGHEVRF